MRFLLFVVLMFGAGAGPVATANGRLATFTQRILPTKQVITEKAGKLAVGAGLIGLTLCGTITGCDRGEQILVDVIDVDDVSLNDGRDSQYVTFVAGGIRYDGYWEDTVDGQLLIELDDGDSRIVLLEQIDGFLVSNHRDIGAPVYLLGEIDGDQIYRIGEVVGVYDNGYYNIEVSYEEYVDDGEYIRLLQPYTMLVHRSLLLEDGGFAFED